MSFKPIHDLESLTDQQREQHYLDACSHFGLPPELRLLNFMWMDANDGKRNLVLYALRGATDLIRDRQGISVVSTVPANGPGYVAFIVEGRNAAGRTEFAVGSASLNQNLANNVMIAHTRAVRRLTLQFVGGGLLDESEVQGVVSDISRSGASLASLATIPAPIQPTTTPNAQPGKDITPLSGIELAVGMRASTGIDALVTPPAPITKTEFINGFTATPKQIASAKLRHSMVAPEPFSGGSIIPAQVEQITETSQPLVQIEPALEAPKRHRRTKAEMAATRGVISLDSPVSTVAENPAPVESQQTVTISNIPVIPAEIGTTRLIMGGVPIEIPLPNPDTPTKEEVAVWKSKLSIYTTQGGILNQGGMTENLFGKIRLYTMTLFPNAVVLPNKAIMLTNKQWADLLGTFQHITAVNGPAGLVAAIEALDVLK